MEFKEQLAELQEVIHKFMAVHQNKYDTSRHNEMAGKLEALETLLATVITNDLSNNSPAIESKNLAKVSDGGDLDFEKLIAENGERGIFGFNGMEKENSDGDYDFGAKVYNGRIPDWIPSIDKNTGKIILTAEKGDDLNSLIDFFGGPNEAAKYVPRTIIASSANNTTWPNYLFAEGSSLTYNENNNYAEGVLFHSNVINEGDGSSFQMLRCHNVCMLGTRGQSLVDIPDGSSLNSFNENVRDDLIKEQYSEISINEDGIFNFESEGIVGESILTVGKAHTAVYFGTNKDGTQYFLNKANASGDYTIDTYEETMNSWGSGNPKVGAYTIKDEFKRKKLTEDDVSR